MARKKARELTFQKHGADFLVREHRYGGLDDSEFGDGTHVVVSRGQEGDVRFSPDELAELEVGIAEADRRETISGEELFARLRRYGWKRLLNFMSRGEAPLLAVRFGERLICVRCRCDEQRRKRFTTVELIVAEADRPPRGRSPRATRSPEDMVYVRVAYGEQGVRAKLKASGAPSRARLRLWAEPWGALRARNRGAGSEEWIRSRFGTE